MIALEYEIEKSLRVAIRTSINAKAVTVPELAEVKIIGFRLDSEDETEAGQDANGLRVFITAMPNSSDGFNGPDTIGPLRNMPVDIGYVTQPDNDISRTIFVALENAVRSVFETFPIPYTMPSGVQFGAAMITGAGSSDFGDYGQFGAFTVNMVLSLT